MVHNQNISRFDYLNSSLKTVPVRINSTIAVSLTFLPANSTDLGLVIYIFEKY